MKIFYEEKRGEFFLKMRRNEEVWEPCNAILGGWWNF